MHGQTCQSIENADQVIAATRKWLERAVIGLQLCPFAVAPHLHDRVRYCVSAQRSGVGLLEELAVELQALQDADPLKCETTLLIHPQVLTDFREYNDFLGACDAAIAELGFEGELQVASFHPRYQFAGTGAQDIENYTNRSPYPMLHLLREASVARAVANFPTSSALAPRTRRRCADWATKGGGSCGSTEVCVSRRSPRVHRLRHRASARVCRKETERNSRPLSAWPAGIPERTGNPVCVASRAAASLRRPRR